MRSHVEESSCSMLLRCFTGYKQTTINKKFKVKIKDFLIKMMQTSHANIVKSARDFGFHERDFENFARVRSFTSVFYHSRCDFFNERPGRMFLCLISIGFYNLDKKWTNLIKFSN